jgi:hypothetical protein
MSAGQGERVLAGYLQSFSDNCLSFPAKPARLGLP